MTPEDQTKVEIITHPDGSQTANGHVIRTAFQAEVLKKSLTASEVSAHIAEEKRKDYISHCHHTPHHIGDIVYINQTQFKITGIAFYHNNHISYQLFAILNDTISIDWYTEDFFTTAPGKKIGFDTE